MKKQLSGCMNFTTWRTGSLELHSDSENAMLLSLQRWMRAFALMPPNADLANYSLPHSAHMPTPTSAAALLLLHCVQVWLWNMDSGAVMRKLVAPDSAPTSQPGSGGCAITFCHGDLK